MISLIDRYIIKAHIAPFIFGTGTVLFILLMQFLMISLGELVGKGLSEWLIIKLIVFNMAWMVILAVPMGVLFSTLMTFGSMSMAHEVTIVKASGGSFLRMLMPILISSILLYLSLYYFNDVILPESNHQVKIMTNDIHRKKPTFALESGLFSTQLDGYTILARNVDSISGDLSGVTIYDMTKFQNCNIISSDSGKISFTPDYKKLVLDLKEGEIHQFSVNNVDDYKVIRFSEYRIAMNAYGFAFEQSSSDMVSKGDREMNVTDMQAIVDTAESNRSNLLRRVDSLINKTVLEYVQGIRPAIKDTLTDEIASDSTFKSELQNDLNDDNIVIITDDSKQTTPTNRTKEMTDDELEDAMLRNKGIAKSINENHAAEVKRKFEKAVAEGRTDINQDTVLSYESKAKLYEKVLAEKKNLQQISDKEAALAASKVKSDSDRIKKVTEKVVTSQTKKIAITDNDSHQEADTSYYEVLNRMIQHLNLTKSSLQADVNNVKFYEARSKQYRVEIYKKYSLPFACVIFVLVGAPLGIITKGGNFGISAAISLVFYVFYWACLIGGEKLGDRGMIPPWFAMWMANIIVGIIGILLTIRVNNESIKFKLPSLNRKKSSLFNSTI